MKVIKEDNSIFKDYSVLTGANLNRIVKGHDKDGYIMISACRENADLEDPKNEQQVQDENNIRTEKLRQDIRACKYSYIPIYGGYREEGSNKASIEKSFIVFPFNRVDKTLADYNTFLDNMVRLGIKYNQDSILVKKPNSSPQYFNCRTLKFTGDIFNNVSLNDMQKEYFTALKKWSDSGRKGDSINWQGKQQRFTYEESYINKSPCNNLSGHLRYSTGELF